MPLDAPMTAAEPAPPPGTVDSFRLLTARLRRAVPPEPRCALADAPPVPLPDPMLPPDPGAAAAALLNIIWGALDLPPQERGMAGDTLLLLLPRLSVKDLGMIAERISAMDAPPPLLVSRLVRDPRAEVGGVVLERSAHLDATDLLAACESADPERLLLLARRRRVPQDIGDHLVRAGDLLSLLALLRNPGAEISFQSFLRLSQLAGEHPGLQAPLALRTDLPLAVALDLLWRLPPDLRRVIIARFLSDSVTLSRILSIALASGERSLVEAARPAEIDAALAPLFFGRREEAAGRLARLAGIMDMTAERILADAEGEAVVVLLKALGLGRSCFDDALDRLRAAGGLIREDRPAEELKVVFDALSFTKARVLLTYWDWFTSQSGPYAPPAEPGLVEHATVA